MKKHWRAALIFVIAALPVWGLWYARPVDIYGVAPEVRDPAWISIDIRDLNDDAGQERPSSSRHLTPEDPAWEAVLSEIESLRFRRPPWNPVLQFVPQNTVTGRITHDGDRNILFSVGGRRGGSIRVQFFIDEWSYNSPHSNRSLTLWVEDSRRTGDALAEALEPPGGL